METEKTKKRPIQDRVALPRDALARLDAWLSQVNNNLQWGAIGRSELLHWCLMAHPETLSDGEIENLKALHFDEEKYTRWAPKQVQIARTEGKEISIFDLMGNIKRGHS